MEKIGEIREAFASCELDQLPQLMTKYQSDERGGVQALIAKAQRRIDVYEAEVARIETLKVYEKQYDMYSYICGIDEAGRGPFAGPVCAGAVILPKDSKLLYLNDSKKLSEKKREELFDQIKDYAVSYGIGFATPERIDEINILQATFEAMRDAVSQLSPQPDLLLNDAVRIPDLPMQQVPIVHGDAKSVSIAAASILAKVTRDRLMLQYDEIYPEYGFAKNKGYGTADHIAALRKFGPTPIHRHSFIHDYE